MTLTPDRLDESDMLPACFNAGLVLRTEEPAPRPTMEDFRESMDEMERSYRMFQTEYLATWPVMHTPPIIQAPAAEPPLTADTIYDAVRDTRSARMYTDPYGDYPGSPCYCGPGRGMFFDRRYESSREREGAYARSRREAAMEALLSAESDLALTYKRWEPDPEPVASKELAVIPAPPARVGVMEVIPAPKCKAPWVLAGVGALIMALGLLSGCGSGSGQDVGKASYDEGHKYGSSFANPTLVDPESICGMASVTAEGDKDAYKTGCIDGLSSKGAG